ncbi:MAG: PrgI family protein [Candidatus Sungbacteria bacterium]|nr:PrgI family protein [Candidatus Sungbacteria bacterium]
MRQFQVPQFINIEDKIIGPLTLKQFLYLVGGGAAVLLAWFGLNTFFFVLVSAPTTALSLALAFLKINDQTFPTVFMNSLNFYLKPRLYLWKRAAPARTAGMLPKEDAEKQTKIKLPTLTESRLNDLSWSLDIKEKLNR